MKLRDKNPVLKDIIIRLKRQQAPVWKAVALSLNRPRREWRTVSVYQLEKQAVNVVVVPGTVLSDGQLTKPLTVSAYKVSPAARQKIEQAGGTCLSLEEGMQKYPEGKGLQVMG